ncbi:MAG TPA: 2-C-methyl-D-erythritol 4-phosphate cytidylyltransferase [Acidimicrobiia bacterium]|nr:2-C-methyl-D-erythritol 4-phosphate cytidylyltransferase [Acidimicrobiia bacterium]
MAPAARPRTAAVVVAGGRGERFGAPKQFLTVGSSRLVDLAVAAASAVCDVVVVVLPGDRAWDGPAVAATAVGGASRSASVRAGLDEVPADVEIVTVHDAARPLAPPELFELVIDTVRAGADAAVPALPINDTVKRVSGDRAVETLDRSELVTVQTPQAFRVTALRAAHAGGAEATDDAALIEASGGTVVVVPGDRRNVKVTDVADLHIVESLMRADAR